jgi:hypothetical protein
MEGAMEGAKMAWTETDTTIDAANLGDYCTASQDDSHARHSEKQVR